MAECVASDPKGLTGADHIYFVPSRAERSSITPTADTLVASTNLKRDTGNTEDSLCDWVQLKGINLLRFSVWRDRPLRIQRCTSYPSPQPSPSIRVAAGSIPSTILRVHGATIIELPPMRSSSVEWDGSCKETDGSVCRESKFYRTVILSNDNDPCARSDNERTIW